MPGETVKLFIVVRFHYPQLQKDEKKVYFWGWELSNNYYTEC